ncbi:HAD family phosphatase [Candidatus Gottesmanbacteria bacterium]|nr:HAD family phosphatase [Candidatus Gottesmanbacteria bacterium]
MYKLVILDYDGTMVGKSGEVSQRVKKSIEKVREKGVKVSISTGRAVYSLKNLIRELDLNLPHVFLAGSLLYNPIKDLILLEEAIKKELVIAANEFALKNNLYLEAATFDKLYYNRIIPTITSKRKKMTKENDGLADLSELVKREKVLVMRFVIQNKEERKLVEALRKSMSDQLNFQMGYAHDFGSIEFWNVTSVSVSKVSALRHLCEYLKIHPSETLAIGDSPIDLPLLENVGMGIAMGNASNIVKQKAKWVAPGVEEEGVAIALEKFILIS